MRENLCNTLRRGGFQAVVVGSLLVVGNEVAAQTDYYNTDRGRPLEIEDAYAAEQYAADLKLAPVRFERAGSETRWTIHPEIAYGLLPRTNIEVGAPITFSRDGDRTRSGLSGLGLSVLHNLNAETERWPALGLRADLLLPVGSFAESRAFSTVTALLTRTYSRGRIHINGQYTAGGSTRTPDSGKVNDAAEIARWMTGVSVDKTFPLRSALIAAEFFARKPIYSDAVEYVSGVGMRYQLTPAFALDGGFGRNLRGPRQGWYATLGTAFQFGIPSLIPRT